MSPKAAKAPPPWIMKETGAEMVPSSKPVLPEPEGTKMGKQNIGLLPHRKPHAKSSVILLKLWSSPTHK